LSSFDFEVPGSPASANRRLIGGRSRWVPDPKYADYKERVRSRAKAAAMEHGFLIRSKAHVYIELWNCRLDLDNSAKVILDGLEGIGFANDRDITMLTITRHKDGAKPYVIVTVNGVHQ